MARALGGEGLPRINALVDRYNAASVLHAIPVGGEDLDRVEGPVRLVAASGDEPFDDEHPRPGEIVWADALGVTCRRWNWRQGLRTQLSGDATTALFILDALEPMDDEALQAATDDLVIHLTQLGPDVRVVQRLISAGPALAEGD
jgi:DNA/RNA-binding domain of Phe-tRNA-synthetase-like protein